ncbi:MAG TPA: alpha/beta hydrolase [Longimicrobiales bacterium]|nr:alpha/beta hydrolase [Longimicrobiales bacterium]
MPDRCLRSILLASIGLVLSLALTAATLHAQTDGHPDNRSSEASLRSGHFRTSDGVQLHYLEAGSGPTLVFVPAWTLPAWIWRPQLEHFSARYHVVALDPRGQGDSEKPTEGYTTARLGRDIHELLEHLGGGPAVLVGWSLGVNEVLGCVSQFGTGDIRALVLVDERLYLPRDSSFSRGRKSGWTPYSGAGRSTPGPSYGRSMLGPSRRATWTV